MKIIKYKIHRIVNLGTEDNPKLKEIFSPVEMGWNEANEEIAKREAYKGKYTIEDNGIEEIPTQEDRFEAQLTYTAMMTGTLLEEV